MITQSRLSTHDTNVSAVETYSIWSNGFAAFAYQENSLIAKADWKEWSLHVFFWMILVAAQGRIQMIVVYDASFWFIAAEWQTTRYMFADGFDIAWDWREVVIIVDFSRPVVMVAYCCPA